MEKPEQKRVVLCKILIPMEFPSSWSDGDIEFYLNDSGWCASSILDILDKVTDGGEKCICNDFKGYPVNKKLKEEIVKEWGFCPPSLENAALSGGNGMWENDETRTDSVP